jgi:hypothetical protein
MQYTLLFLLSIFVLASDSAAQSVPEANPGRPTVSTPATLTPVGYLQFENGFLSASDSPEFSTRFGVNQVTKLAVHQRVQLIVQSEPYTRSRSEGKITTEPGEVFAGGQFVMLPGDEAKPTVSVSYFRRLHESPAPEIDIGTNRQSGLLLVSGDLLGFHADANGIVAQQSDKGVDKAQLGQTLSISHLLGSLTIAGEIWHFSQPFLRSDAIGNLWAVSYPLRRNLIVDGGFDRGLTSTSTRWELFAGFTYLLPYRLWK